MAEENVTVKTPVFGSAVAQLRAGAAVRIQRMKAQSKVRMGSYPATHIGPGKVNFAAGGIKRPSALAILYPKTVPVKAESGQTA